MQQIINKYPQLSNISNPYMFLKQELEITKLHPNDYSELKNHGWIRHCTPLKNGKLYDYIVKQEYNTIEAWVASWAPTSYLDHVYKIPPPTLKDVCYGINRNQSTGMYSTKYVVPFEEKKVVPTNHLQMKELVDHLESKKMDMSSVMINFNGMILPLHQFMRI
jgi:hypothetical protein